MVLFTFHEADGKLIIHLNPCKARALPPSILEEPGINEIPFFDKNVLLEGPVPNWIYAHFAVMAVIKGAREVFLRQAGIYNDTQVWPFVPSGAGIKGAMEESCFKIVLEKPGIVHLEFNKAPDEMSGKWTMADFLNTPLQIPEKTETLIIRGTAANWMCAVAAIAVYRAGIRNILCYTPRELSYINIGLFEPGKSVQQPSSVENGLVIGIAGDPNSGKSVFKYWLEKSIKDIWPNSWWMDADPASPTPNWYLDGLNSGLADKVKKIRDESKQSWTHELELMVVDILRNLRRNLDVTIVDLPGGNFNVAPPLRIPPGREVIYKEIDLFIIIWKDEAALVDWRSNLQKYNLENHIFAEIESREPKGQASLAIKKKNCIITGTACGLDRNNAGHYAKSHIKDGISELIRHIQKWKTARCP